MLDGPSTESMSTLVRPQRGNSEVALERKGAAPNFTDIPTHLLKDGGPQRIDDQPTPAEIQLIEQIMNQSANQKKSVNESSNIDKPVSTISAMSNTKSEIKPSNEEKKEPAGLKEKIKVVWEKIKAFGKKVWYYGSGSFIWDKIF